MRFIRALVCAFTLSLFFSGAYATSEYCPTSAALKKIFSSDFSNAEILTSDGKMPYETSPPMVDPLHENGEWFVVSRNFSTTHQMIPDPISGLIVKSDDVPYVAFVIFKDTDDGGISTVTHAMTWARTIVAGISDRTNTVAGRAIDYPHFFIGQDDSGKNFYFDVCLYAGTFNQPVGTADTTMANMNTFPVVMADLSPGA